MPHDKRKIIGPVVLALIAAFFAYRYIAGRSHDNIILASGTVEATEADLGFQVPGRLEQISVREGSTTRVGDELASLERAELLAERAVAIAQVASARALLDELTAGTRREEIARARADLTVATQRRDAARRDVDRLRELAEQSLISKQSFDHQETALKVADGEVSSAAEELSLLVAGPRRERIAAQRAELAEASATVQRIDAMLSQVTIAAPFNGTVSVRHREPGEAVAAGSPVLTLRDLGDRWVRIYVPGDEVGRLALGQKATMTADGFENRSYEGVISHIASVAEFTPRNVQTTKDRVRLVYEVRVRITGDSSVDLKPGLPTDVRFDVPNKSAVASSGTRSMASASH
ncbi:MAG TPA: HlyD family efflux transporter periplasmic adaptor subunit [Gemmatimonadaceae bacterium]|nr:HlyD family efflux transporter periplasmic adaptor subunit [Gemmatimonadaceae bacterium]